MYTTTYVHHYICTSTHIHNRTYVHMCTLIQTFAHVCVNTYLTTYIAHSIRLRMRTSMDAYTCTGQKAIIIYVYIYIYIYTHAHIHAHVNEPACAQQHIQTHICTYISWTHIHYIDARNAQMHK